MSSAREVAMAALADTLRATGAKVWRSSDIPKDLPPTGLIQVAEGEAVETAIMSPLRWEIDQHALVIVTVTAGDEIARDAAMDELLATIATLLAADRTLGGAVDWVEPMSPTFQPDEIDGAGKSAHMPVTLSFVAEGTVLGPRAA